MLKAILLSFSIACIFLSSSASAFELKPLHTSLTPSGAGAERVFRVTNTRDTPIAVQFKTTTRQQRPDGSEQQNSSDSSFMIFPPQAVIPPHKTQKVRVQWLGDQNPSKELAYRFVAEQVPVRLSKENKTGVQMVMTLVGSIYIEPQNVQHNVSIDNIHRAGNQLAFTVRNSGTKHALLGGLNMTLSGSDGDIQLSGKQLRGAEGKNILAGSYRNLSIPYPVNISSNQNMSAEISFY